MASTVFEGVNFLLLQDYIYGLCFYIFCFQGPALCYHVALLKRFINSGPYES